MAEFQFPSETIDLPSRGLLYPSTNPLSSGKVDLKYPSAASEDILTNQSYIQKGTVLDKLLESLFVNKDIKVKDLVVGDKNALLIAARILGYGKEYKFNYRNEEQTVDLSILENKEFDESLITKGVNEFIFTLPASGTNITFKILNGEDENNIDRELEGLKKINKNISPDLTTRLKYMITSVNGSTEKKDIREFVDKHMLAMDSREFRQYIKKIQPDVNMTVTMESGVEAALPIGISFFGLSFEIAPQQRFNLFDLIDEMVMCGAGAYSWQDIYNMPIWLRVFTYNKMKKRNEKNNTSTTPKGQKNLVNPDGSINKQTFKEANENMSGKVSYK